MRVFITQCDVPPPIPPAMALGIVAQPGGQSDATPLTAKRNVVSVVASATGVLLQAIQGGEQRVWNTSTNGLLVFPTLGTAFFGQGLNIPVLLPAGSVATYQFDGVSTWYVS